MTCRYAIVDVEVGVSDHKIHDIGALRYDGAVYHGCSLAELTGFLSQVEFLCGHNIIHHDASYLWPDGDCPFTLVDTLYLSPLLFPERPYHRLLKDDKLISEQMNNPVNDRGYSPSAAAVRFVVAWKPKDAAKEEPETAVLLIDLTLSMP